MRPQITARTPAVLDELLSLLQTAQADTGHPLAAVQILDGPPVSATAYEDDVVQVGAGDYTDAGVIVDRTPVPGLGRTAYAERVEVAMLVSCYSGATDMKALRDRASDVFNAIKVIVDEHQVVDGVWDRLLLGPQELWHQSQSGDGATSYVAFTVVAEAIG